LIVLASLSVVVGVVFGPTGLFHDWVHVGEAAQKPVDYGFAAVSILGALAGIAVGYRLYARWRERDPLRRLGPAYVVLENKYYLDDLYMKGVVRPVQYRLSAAVYWTNQKILDGGVNGAAWLTRKLGLGVDAVDRKGIDGAVNGVGQLTRGSGGLLKYMQAGYVQWYAAALFGGVVVFIVVAYLFTSFFS
jgi:NADH-quinone oxidoreductase subunit L